MKNSKVIPFMVLAVIGIAGNLAGCSTLHLEGSSYPGSYSVADVNIVEYRPVGKVVTTLTQSFSPGKIVYNTVQWDSKGKTQRGAYSVQLDIKTPGLYQFVPDFHLTTKTYKLVKLPGTIVTESTNWLLKMMPIPGLSKQTRIPADDELEVAAEGDLELSTKVEWR
jgi:hypothetical protein